MLEENNISQSMSQKGNYYDNLLIENFLVILKQEIYYGKIFYNYTVLKQAETQSVKPCRLSNIVILTSGYIQSSRWIDVYFVGKFN